MAAAAVVGDLVSDACHAQLTLLAWREEHVSADGFQHAGVTRFLKTFFSFQVISSHFKSF